MSDMSKLVDAMLECFFLGKKPPENLTVGALKKGGVEVSASGYSRVSIDDSVEVGGGAFFNNKDILFAPAGENWGEITGVALYSKDKELLVFKFKDGVMVEVGSRLRIPANQMSINIIGRK